MHLASIDILVRCPLFAQAEDDDLQALADASARRTYATGETLFLAGSLPEGLHVVARGRIGISVLSPGSGRELLLSVEHPYNAVAELPSFDGGPYPAHAEALEDSETVFILQADFERILHERPGLALLLLRTLGRRLRRLVGLVESLSFQEVIHRLAGHLADRAADEGVPFELDTNARMGALLGTVPELVSRNLARLHRSGVVELEGRRVVAVDRDALADLGEAAGR